MLKYITPYSFGIYFFPVLYYHLYKRSVGAIMVASEAQLRASKKYQQKFDKVQIRVPHDEKEQIDVHAERMGESVNTFVRRAIFEAIERDTTRNKD